MANPYLQISGDAQAALEQFSTEMFSALAAAPADPWATRFGMYRQGGIKWTFPIPISAAGYVERKGNDQLRSLYERSLTIETKEWVDGVREKAAIIEAPDFIDWAGEPARIALEADRLANRIVAALLEANGNLSFYIDRKTKVDAGIPLFSSSHKVNVYDSSLGTFDNDHDATAIDSIMLKAALQRFRLKPGANGKPMGLRVTDMLVSPGREQEAKDFLESDRMYLALLDTGSNTNATAANRFQNAVNLVVCDELSTDNYIYLLDSRTVAPKAWAILEKGPVEELRLDKSSQMYFDSGDVAIKYVKSCDAAGVLPHAIERIHITG